LKRRTDFCLHSRWNRRRQIAQLRRIEREAENKMPALIAAADAAAQTVRKAWNLMTEAQRFDQGFQAAVDFVALTRELACLARRRKEGRRRRGPVRPPLFGEAGST
jgi:hypothetical protein